MYIFELKTQRRLVANIERRFPKLADLLPVLSVKKLRKKQAIDRCPKCLKIEEKPSHNKYLTLVGCKRSLVGQSPKLGIPKS
jgi:hypothetical protein